MVGEGRYYFLRPAFFRSFRKDDICFRLPLLYRRIDDSLNGIEDCLGCRIVI